MIAGWRLQLLVLLGAGVVWSVHPTPDLLGLVGAYALAWLGLSLSRAFAPGLWKVELTRAQAVALGLALAVPPAVRAADLGSRFLVEERLDSIVHQTEARRWLERTPSIFPPLLAADRPQTFYVNAPGARAVSARVGGGEVEATSLGHGVFRLEVEPRDLELPARSGALDVELLIDGAAHARELRFERRLAHPRWLRPSPDRARVITTSEETDEVVLVDRDGAFERHDVGDGPVDAAFVGDGSSWVVAHRYEDELRFEGASPGRVAIGPLAEHLAVDGEDVAVTRAGARPELVLVRGRAVRARTPLAFAPEWVAFAGEHVVVSGRRPAALYRFDRDGRAQGDPLPLGRPAVTLTAAGDAVIVAVTDLSTDGEPHLGNHFVRDQLVTVDAPSWRIVATELTADRTPRQRAPGDIDRGVSPMGVDVAPDGARWVAFAGTDDVARVGAGTDRRRFELDEHPLAAPISAVELAGGRFAVSSACYGTVGIFSASGDRRALVRLAPGDQELLRDDQPALQRRIGERGFYEATRSGVACQSCHLHEGSDGALHNIGDKTHVATLDTRGIYGTPPYLRDGGYPFLGSLDELAQTLYRGYLRHQGGRRIGLDRYLGSLPRATPPRQLEGRDLARERRGLDAFFRARCPVCHAPPAFTNLGQHPVATLFPRRTEAHASDELDTPSLLGLGESAPYLVDGRAATLEAVFADEDPSRRHGHHGVLSETELADLIHFLGGL
ncbi:MAG: hypothetical protein H6719_32815 [Sandaracinaceae bacterium]|nr:hypothetical protein [Sandaracinaceae bacterium]